MALVVGLQVQALALQSITTRSGLSRLEFASCSYCHAGGLRRRSSVKLSRTWRRDKFRVFAAGDDDGGDDGTRSPSSEADLEAIESRLGLGRRARRDGGGGESRPKPPPSASSQESSRSKKWEELSPAEQAWSLWSKENGVLFWLNKLAYASIFALIGGWIVFRFIGPALGWYELDSPLLPPDQVLG